MGSFPEMFNDPISFGASEADIFSSVIIFYIFITFMCGLAVISLGENGY